MTQKTTITMEPLAPFDLALSALVFSAGDRRVRSFQEDCFSQVIAIDAKELVWVKLTSNGSVNNPKLTLELHGNHPRLEKSIHKAQQVVSHIFSLDMSLGAFYEHIQADPVMSRVTQELVGFKFPTTPTVFEAFVDAIVEQQISIKVARSIEERLAVMFGESINVEGEAFFAFPSAAALVDAGVERIRQSGLSMRKSGYIHGIAQLVVDGDLDLEELKFKDVKEVVSVLDEVHGVGVWTAELTMLRGMRRFEVLPADDFGLRRVISRYYCGNKSIDALEARRIAEGWGTWRGLAAFYLIIAEVQGVII